ncbi:MAG: energy transducer TonB [Flavobacteriales bacterium]|nr:energy transducer TonB [Flavobacteriales bacterium]
MKASNSPLERKRPLLFAIGLLFAVSLTLVSFEWRTPYESIVIPVLRDSYDGPIWIPRTIPEPEKKMEQPDPPIPDPITDQFEIKDDNLAELGKDEYVPTEDDFVEGTPIEDGGDEPEVPDEDFGPMERSSIMPEYCTGEAAMLQFLGNNLVYPDIPRENGVTGVVYVQFVVGKDGKVHDVKVLRPLDPWLDGEALRVTKLLDCFTPGKQGGRAVDVYFRLPIRFSLNG